MSMQTKASIVFVHGIWADGSNPGLVIDVIRTAANAVQRPTIGE